MKRELIDSLVEILISKQHAECVSKTLQKQVIKYRSREKICAGRQGEFSRISNGTGWKPRCNIRRENNQDCFYHGVNKWKVYIKHMITTTPKYCDEDNIVRYV